MELKHPSAKREWEHREREAVTERGAHPPVRPSQLLAGRVFFSWNCGIFLKRKVDPVRNPEIKKKKRKKRDHPQRGKQLEFLVCLAITPWTALHQQTSVKIHAVKETQQGQTGWGTEKWRAEK